MTDDRPVLVDSALSVRGRLVLEIQNDVVQRDLPGLVGRNHFTYGPMAEWPFFMQAPRAGNPEEEGKRGLMKSW